MARAETYDALLVVVASSEAKAVEIVLETNGIARRRERGIARVVEFGNELGARPVELYVRAEDLDRARAAIAQARRFGTFGSSA